ARAPAARQAGRRGRADPHRQERGLSPGSGRLTVGALILLLRRRIALKLTLTLVGFTGIAALAAGLYVNRALEGFAADSLEARLAAVGRVLHDETRVQLPADAGGPGVQAFAVRAARTPGAGATVVAPDGRGPAQ